MKHRRPTTILALLALAAITSMIYLQRSRPVVTPVEKVTTASITNTAVAAHSVAAPSPLELERRKTPYADFQKHPFAVVRENTDFGWTAEDGKNPDVIRKLAHNELEFERLAEESSRILRRQLVYCKDTIDAQIERAKLTGAPIQQLALPGLDGQEVNVQITRSELDPASLVGGLSGQITDRPGSMVTLAFKGGREAFTILSPADNLYLVGEPREPGELIVKSINPATYVAGTCGTP